MGPQPDARLRPAVWIPLLVAAVCVVLLTAT